MGVQIPKNKPGRKRKSLSYTCNIPYIPEGETEETIETQRKEMMKINMNGTQDFPKMKLLMDNTFPKQRRDVLQDSVRVWKILEEYPCLKEAKGVEASLP